MIEKVEMYQVSGINSIVPYAWNGIEKPEDISLKESRRNNYESRNQIQRSE